MANALQLIGGSVPRGLESLMKVRKVTRITDIVRKENSMTDRENIRAYIEKLHQEHRGSKGDSIFRKALRTVLFYIDSMQEESSTSVWHDASEEPKEKDKPIAIQLHNGELWSPYIVEELSQGWEVFKENTDIKKWAYTSDLIKL